MAAIAMTSAVDERDGVIGVAARVDAGGVPVPAAPPRSGGAGPATPDACGRWTGRDVDEARRPADAVGGDLVEMWAMLPFGVLVGPGRAERH